MKAEPSGAQEAQTTFEMYQVQGHHDGDPGAHENHLVQRVAAAEPLD